MKKYECIICGYVYDEAQGGPDTDIPPGTKWDALPEEWRCPVCGAPKVAFEPAEDAAPDDMTNPQQDESDIRVNGLSFAAMSALCSNLAKGCEKQFRPEEAALYTELAEYFSSKRVLPDKADFDMLADAAKSDVQDTFAPAKQAADKNADRGALRALTWSEKVTRMLGSHLAQYAKKKGALLEDADIYVCEICGFVYIGNEAPEICPVCKVPKLKISKIERSA